MLQTRDFLYSRYSITCLDALTDFDKHMIILYTLFCRQLKRFVIFKHDDFFIIITFKCIDLLKQFYNFQFFYLLSILATKKQSKFNQLDIGTYFNLEPINFGVWYRGVPIDSNNNFNSIISSLGINFKDLIISYSYDYNFSELSDSGGSHEISLIYNFNFLGKKIPPKNAVVMFGHTSSVSRSIIAPRILSISSLSVQQYFCRNVLLAMK